MLVFSKNKNSYAPIVYKTLTFSFIENYLNVQIKEFIMSNFLIAIEEDENIPLSILLDPLIKQLQVTESILNILDFDFFISIAKHPGLEVEYAVLISDFLGKVFYNDIVYNKISLVPFLLLAGRFIDDYAMQQFLVRFVKVGLKMVCLRYKSRFDNDKSIEQNYVVIRNITFGMIEKLISLRSVSLNSKIKNQLLNANTNLKFSSGRNIKGIMAVLALLGEPSELIDSYEQKTPKELIASIENSTTSTKDLTTNDFSDIKPSKEKPKNLLDNDLKKIDETIGHKHKANSPIIYNNVEKPDDFVLIIYEDELECEKDLLKIVFSRYQRVISLLFNRYSASGHKSDAVAKLTFDSIKDVKSVITEGEIRKMLRENGVSKEMIMNPDIKKIYSALIIKQRTPTLSFYDFPNVLINVS